MAPYPTGAAAARITKRRRIEEEKLDCEHAASFKK